MKLFLLIICIFLVSCSGRHSVYSDQKLNKQITTYLPRTLALSFLKEIESYNTKLKTEHNCKFFSKGVNTYYWSAGWLYSGDMVFIGYESIGINELSSSGNTIVLTDLDDILYADGLANPLSFMIGFTVWMATLFAIDPSGYGFCKIVLPPGIKQDKLYSALAALGAR